jgi:hypothetical protein
MVSYGSRLFAPQGSFGELGISDRWMIGRSICFRERFG